MSPMNRFSTVVRLVGLAAIVFLAPAMLGRSQSLARSVPAEGPVDSRRNGSAVNAADALSIEQQRIADKFKRLEDILLRMAELTAVSDPRRAALLKKTVARSKQELIGVQLHTLVELLQKGQLSKAIGNQEQLDGDLRGLLELLLSENRAQRIESEKARIRDYLKRLNQIIKTQKDVQGRTAGGENQDRLADQQGKLADASGSLAEKIQRNEEPESDDAGREHDRENGQKPKEGEPNQSGNESGRKTQDQTESDPKDEGQTPDRKQSGENRQDPQEPDQDKKNPEGQGKPQNRHPKQAKGERAQQGDLDDSRADQPQDPSSEDGHPARKRLQAARERMRNAQQKLRRAERDGAVDEQEEAIRRLEQAKAALEKILRQLREEEIEQVLVMLQTRFLKMLQMQRAVHEGTCRLDEASQDGMTHNQEIEASRLSSREAEIVLEADKALTLLRAEGSAVAFPEALGQVRDDMRQVTQLLARAKLDQFTQEIEEEVMAALEELIEALEKAQKDAEQRRKRPADAGRPGQPQEPSLVDLLAEIKLIRALQLRVNNRTGRYAKLIGGESAPSAELLDALQLLAQRQRRIYQITRDLERSMNR